MDCFNPVPLWSQGIRVPCGRCAACLMNRAEDWKSRLSIEREASSSAYFVTLTYDDEHLPHDLNGNPCFCPGHLKDFHKKMRVYLKRGELIDNHFGEHRFKLDNRKFKYFLTSEYGPDSGHRPHYHGIYFNLPDDIYLAELLIRKAWIYGTVITVSEVTEGRISYTAEYALNARLCSFAPKDWMPHIFRVSKGIGSALMDSSLKDWMRENPAKRVYLPTKGGSVKRRLSRYLKDKVFDDDMKARIQDEYALRHRILSFDELRDKALNGLEYERQVINRIRSKKLHYV